MWQVHSVARRINVSDGKELIIFIESRMDTKFENIEAYNCVSTKNMYSIKRAEGIAHKEIMEVIWKNSRDNSRTPMQWDGSCNAGFSTGRPWLGMNPNYTEINVAAQQKDPASILNFHKKLITLKKENHLFIYGAYDLILPEDEQIYAYTRTLESKKAVIICNLTDKAAVYEHKDIELAHEALLLSNYEVEHHEKSTSLVLRPYETRIYEWLPR
jgi:alpha-glucosidase